jgi:hypothetical protein
MVCRKIKIYAFLCGYVDGWICSRVGIFLEIHSTNLTDNRLGDRHGENILFEEGTGGILHVDFNCLFDKVGLYLKAHPKSLLIV